MSPITVQFDHLVAGSESYQIGSDRIVFFFVDESPITAVDRRAVS